MQTTHIGMWEFIHQPQRLTYRMTPIGLLPGTLMMSLLTLVFAIWCYQTWRAAADVGSYLGSLVLAAITLGCGYGLFHHLRSRFHPYVLDKRTDAFPMATASFARSAVWRASRWWLCMGFVALTAPPAPAIISSLFCTTATRSAAT